MSSPMCRLLAVVTLAFSLLAPLPGFGADLSLYDDFSEGSIDAAKWQNLEIVREIRDGKLVSVLRSAGPPGQTWNPLVFANPTSIQSMRADVRLNAYTPPPGGDSRIRLRGSYYNDGTAGPGATGDVAANIRLDGRGSGVDIRYVVYRCTNADCSTQTEMIPLTKVKSAAVGEVHTLGIAWDGAVFTFTVDGVDTMVDPRPLVPIVNPTPNAPNKELSTLLNIVEAGGEGYVAGDFDNVYVNGVLYDNFDGAPYSGPRLDPALWAGNNLELVREIQGGKFVSKTAVAGPTGDVRNRLRPVNQNVVRTIRADVTVTEYQSSDGHVHARLGRVFYNDGSTTGGADQTGDINPMIEVLSYNGAPLTVQFHAHRVGDPLGNTTTILNNFFDTLGTINPGETHTLLLQWDGSVFTYGLDDTIHTFDPKPYAPVNKPPIEHMMDLRTDAHLTSFIAATFDNVYVNNEALALPRLAPSYTQAVNGDVVTAGVGLRGTGTGTINLSGIPAGATIQKAFLHWGTAGSSGTFTSSTLNATPVNGTLIGQSDDPVLGVSQAFAYRADVTDLVLGNGSYTIYGLPAGPLPPASTTVNDSLGASLVAIYSLPGAPSRTITITDGAVTLIGPALSTIGTRVQEYTTALKGFLAADPPTGAHLTFLVGNGSVLTPDYAGLKKTLLATNEFSASDGNAWDTKTYDISTAITAGDTSAHAVVSTGNEALVWVAAILSVPGSQPTYSLNVLKTGTGGGTITSDLGGITCGGSCTSTPLVSGSTVILTVTPASGSYLSNWSEPSCGNSLTCSVTMNTDKTVTATFGGAGPTVALTVTKTGTGSGTVTSDFGGINCGTACSASIVAGNTVTLAATPASGSYFSIWNVNCTNGPPMMPTCTVMMDQAKTVAATFGGTAAQSYTLTVSKSGTGTGAVTSDFGGINCGAICSGPIASGNTVTLTAAPASGSYLSAWSESSCGSNPSCMVTMDQAKTVTATFTSPLSGLSLYDDFSGETIDATKWSSVDNGELESVREIRGGRLISTIKGGGPPGSLTNNLHFINPATIKSFQADVRLNAYTAPPGGRAEVKLLGSYYNDGTGGPGNETGDVLAQLSIWGNSSGVNIRYRVIKCSNSACSSTTDLVAPTTVKSAALGEDHTLAIAWDGSVFTFTVDGTATVVDPKPLQPIVHAAPNVPFKLLRSQLVMGGAGGAGYVTGDFANIQVNGAAYDNFSGPLIDLTKWTDLDYVREVQNGQLALKAAGTGAAGAFVKNRLRPNNQNAVTALRADVTVTAFQSSNLTVAARLNANLYNDGTSTGGSDATGDVSALIRISSTNGGPLSVSFVANRTNDSQGNTGTDFFTDGLGTVNVGETHTLLFAWDGAVIRYGMDGTTRTFDPKPLYPVAKPPAEHFNDLRTQVNINTANAYGYIAATFDNLSVNDAALNLPRLAPAYTQAVTGDVVTAGVGLRGTGTGTISLTSIPAGATIQKAFLYWSTVGSSGTFTSPTINALPITGTLIGQSDDPVLGTFQSFAYRADVTNLVSAFGNGSYTIYGLPAGPLPPASTTINDSQGASLVVIYSLPGAPSRTIIINDGAVTLIGPAASAVGARLQEYTTALTGFLAANPPTGAHLTFLVGNGQSLTPDYAGLNATLLATNGFSASDGNNWDTKTYDVSSAMAAGDTSAQAVVSTGNEALIWVAAILSVPGSQPTYTLTVTKAGTGTGTVTSDFGGINCGAACSASIVAGNTVTLTATPASGSWFSGFSGASCPPAVLTCAVTMDQTKTVTATFTQQTYTLNVLKTGTGGGTITSDLGGITCGGSCTSTPLVSGSTVILTAAPTSGSYLQTWSEPGCGNNLTCSVTMNTYKSVTATFGGTAPTVALTVTKTGTGSGTVTADFGGINCGAICSAPIVAGNTVTLTATPASGSYFSTWNVNCTNGPPMMPICAVTMDQAKTVTAAFTQQTYTLTVTKIGAGGGTVTSDLGGITCGASCSSTPLVSGTIVTLTAAPASGSYLQTWSEPGCGNNLTCSVTMNTYKSVTATFGGTAPTVALTVTKTGTGSGTVTADFGGINCGAICSAPIVAGNTVTLTATPASGSYFSTWNVNCTNGPPMMPTCAVTMDQAKTVTAAFGGTAPQFYTLTVTRSGTGTMTSDFGGINCGSACSAPIAAGSTVTLTATPASGSSFAGWGGACQGAPTNQCIVTMDAAKSITGIFTGTGTAPTNLSLYDDFSALRLDPTKWASVREQVREIRDGKLFLAAGGSAPSDSSANTALRHVSPPTNLQSLQADVRLTAATPPAAGGYSRLRIRGAFYNDGTTGTGSLGDIWAHAGLRVRPDGTAELYWAYFRCDDADCNLSPTGESGVLGPAAFDTTYTMSIAWNGTAFTFTATPEGGSPLTYTKTPIVASAGPPRTGHLILRAEVSAWTSSPGSEGYTAGTFDNVHINGSLYDDFSGPQIDPAKWRDYEGVRELTDGALTLRTVTPAGKSSQGTTLRVPNPNAVSALAADVTVSIMSFGAGTDTGQAGLRGSLYNTGTGTVLGDVQAEVKYWTNGSGPGNVQLNLYRSEGSQYIPLFNDTLIPSLPLNAPHRLFLTWDGSLITYGADGSVRTVDPRPLAPVAQAPVNPSKVLFVSTSSSGGTASLTAVFDNVAVNPEALAALPGLHPRSTTLLAGDVAAAGVGLRGTGTGTISLTGLPANATVQQAWLYWATLGTAGTFTSPTLNSTPVAGALIGQGDDPLGGVFQTYAYRADVTALVTSNGSYLIAGLPADGPMVNDTEGASLVVLYTVPGAPVRQVAVNDGLATLTFNSPGTTTPIPIPARLPVAQAPFADLQAVDPAGARLLLLAGDGQPSTAITRDFAGLDGVLLASDAFTGSDGAAWDTKTLDASSALTAGTTAATAVVSTWSDSVVWVAAILSLPVDTTPPGAPTVTLANVTLLNQAAVPLTVAGEVGAMVDFTVTDGTGTVSGTGTVPPGGTFATTVNLTGLKDGTLTVQATLTDAAGNRGAPGTTTATKETVSVVPVDGKVRVTYSGLVLNRATNTFDAWATITNTSPNSVLLAPMSLVITSITASGVTLANPTGTMADGKPYVAVPLPAAGLAPGDSVAKILVKFSNPTLVRFTFTSSVLAVDTR